MNKRDITKAVKREFEIMSNTLTKNYKEDMRTLKEERLQEFSAFISTWTVPTEGAPEGMDKNSYLYDALLSGDSAGAANQIYSVYSDRRYLEMNEKLQADREKLRDNETKVLGNLVGRTSVECIEYLSSIGITIKEAEREQQALMSPVDVKFLADLRKEAK